MSYEQIKKLQEDLASRRRLMDGDLPVIKETMTKLNETIMRLNENVWLEENAKMKMKAKALSKQLDG